MGKYDMSMCKDNTNFDDIEISDFRERLDRVFNKLGVIDEEVRTVSDAIIRSAIRIGATPYDVAWTQMHSKTLYRS